LSDAQLFFLKLAGITSVLLLLFFAGIWIVHRRHGRNQATKAAGLCVLLVATTTAALFAGELAVRLALHNVSTTGDNINYFTRRWYRKHPLKLNQLGFWEREVTARLPETIRIIVLGDSFTFGGATPASADDQHPRGKA